MTVTAPVFLHSTHVLCVFFCHSARHYLLSPLIRLNPPPPKKTWLLRSSRRGEFSPAAPWAPIFSKKHRRGIQSLLRSSEHKIRNFIFSKLYIKKIENKQVIKECTKKNEHKNHPNLILHLEIRR